MAPILTFAMTAAITPGPNNIILSTNAVNFGFRKTIPLILGVFFGFLSVLTLCLLGIGEIYKSFPAIACLLYTSPSPRDISGSRMPSSA